MTRRVIQNKRNPIARLLKHFTPKRFQDKKKYNRKKKISGYYMDYDGKERILYEDER